VQVTNAPAIEYSLLVFSINLYVYAVGDASTLYRSADAGLTWVVTGAPKNGITDLAADATGQYLIACNGDGLFLSSNYGASWVLSLSFAQTWLSVTSDSTGLFLAAAGYKQTGSTTVGSIYLNNAIPAPTLSPTARPTQPSAIPTAMPSTPTSQPSAQPTSPTSWPTSQPSSAPSCTLGSSHTGEDGGACSPCVPGEYISDLGGVCQKCPKGEYSSGRGASSCKKCTYPATTVFEGESVCAGYSVHEGATNMAIILSIFAVLTLGPILSVEQRFVVLANLVFPALDVFSDMAYLLGNDFYSPILFYACLLFIIFPVVFFVRVLVEEGAVPQFHYNIRESFWLKAGRDGDTFYYAVFPCFKDGRFPVISCKSHGNLALVFLEGIVWVIALVAQVVSPLIWLLFAIVHTFTLLFWFVLGAFFYMTKTITIGRVWNFWFRVWTGGNEHETNVQVDTHALNTCLQHEFYLETLPQVVIQLVNTFLLRQLSPLAIFSLTLSFIMAINGLYKYIYYRWLTDTSMKVEDIPIDMSLHIKVDCLKIDWLFFEAKLPPMRRSPSAKMTQTSQKKSTTSSSIDGVALGAVKIDATSTENPAYSNPATFSAWLNSALTSHPSNTLSNTQVQHCAKCFTSEGVQDKEQWLAMPLSAKYLKYVGITNTATQCW